MTFDGLTRKQHVHLEVRLSPQSTRSTGVRELHPVQKLKMTSFDNMRRPHRAVFSRQEELQNRREQCILVDWVESFFWCHGACHNYELFSTMTD
jgi:hypothetical protein